MKITQLSYHRVDNALGYTPFEYAVYCEQHQETVKFSISAIAIQFRYASVARYPRDLIEKEASEALKRGCPGCSIPPTRWPNAGEPGGAEL